MIVSPHPLVILVKWIHSIIMLYDGDTGDSGGSGQGLASSLL